MYYTDKVSKADNKVGSAIGFQSSHFFQLALNKKVYQSLRGPRVRLKSRPQLRKSTCLQLSQLVILEYLNQVG